MSPLVAVKTGCNLIVFNFTIRENLSIMRWDNQLFFKSRNWESGTLDALTLGQMDQVKNTATVFDCQLGNLLENGFKKSCFVTV